MGNGDNGNDKKMVPESQLIAAKKAAESRLERAKTELQGEIDALEKDIDSEKKSRLTAESSISKVEKELTAAKKASEELDKVTLERDQATKSRDELNKSVIDLTRQRILAGFKVSEDVQKKLEGMKTLEELKTYAGVLEDVGDKREPGQKFDGGGGSGGPVDTKGKTGMTLIKQGLAERDK